MEKKEENKALPDRSTQFVRLHNSISLILPLNHILEYCKVTTKRPVYLYEPVVNPTLFVYATISVVRDLNTQRAVNMKTYTKPFKRSTKLG